MSEDAHQPVSSPKPLSQILQALSLPTNSQSQMSTATPMNSLITGKDAESKSLIGKQPSEHVLETLRNIAENARKGHLVDDRVLEMCLAQHFGPQRLSVKKAIRPAYGDYGYSPVVVGYHIELDALAGPEKKFIEVLEFLLRPARPDFVSNAISRLRAVMARQSESQGDIQLVIEVYSEHLCEFPPDVVSYVIDKIIASRKWFPLVVELREECAGLLKFRKQMLDALLRCANPLLANTPKPQLAADPRLSMGYRELSKKNWLPCHYEWWIADAQKMVTHYEKLDQKEKADEWRELVKKRQTELETV